MAFNQGPKYRAAGTIKPYSAVKMDYSAGFYRVVAAGAGDFCVGIASDAQKRTPGLPGSDTAIAAEDGDEIDVYGIGDVCKVKAGATVIHAGDRLKAGASGTVVPVGSGDQNSIGWALETAAATSTNKIIHMVFCPMFYHA